MRKNFLINYLALTCILSLSMSPAISYAQDHNVARAGKKKEKEELEIHKSITNIFDVKFAKEYKYKIFPFQFNNDSVAYTVEIVSPMVKKISNNKNIIVKAAQTFGSELTQKDAKIILERESEKYMQSADDIGGTVMVNEDILDNGFAGKEIYITYTDRGKKYGLRIKVYVTNFSKVEQVINAPISNIYSYKSNDFFDSIRLHDGITKKANPLGVGWVDYTAKNKIFTVTLPPVNSEYTPNPPRLSTKTATSEILDFEIKDPVTEDSVFYKATSYKSKKKFGTNSVKHIIVNSHLSRFVNGSKIKKLATEESIIDGTKILRTRLIIAPNKKFPGINVIFVEAHYKGNTLVIQEFSCASRYVKSDLHNTLFSLMKFHPDKYKAPE